MPKTMNPKFAAVAGLLACATACAAAFGQDAQYEIGGPLAGVKLPLYRTQQGEAPGYPGCIPELAAAEKMPFEERPVLAGELFWRG